jgi:hypothetical protein
MKKLFLMLILIIGNVHAENQVFTREHMEEIQELILLGCQRAELNNKLSDKSKADICIEASGVKFDEANTKMLLGKSFINEFNEGLEYQVKACNFWDYGEYGEFCKILFTLHKENCI